MPEFLTKAFVSNIVLTGAGASLALIALKNVISKEKWGAICFKAGQLLSGLANNKVGKAFYEPLEAYAQDLIKLGVDKFLEGLDSDDSNESK